MKHEYKYKAIRVEQTPKSSPFYLMSCAAEELLEWCDVPRKKEDFMAGYQRELDQRHENIKDFFDQDEEKNIIPNAIIIAVDKNTFSVTSETDGVVDFTIKMSDDTFAVQLQKTLDQFMGRLSDEEKQSVDFEDQVNGTEEDDDDPQDESTPPSSYLASLTSLLKKAKDGWDGVPSDQKKVIEEYISSTSKPGLILDGQHRVFGAKNVSAFDVKLPIVLLPGLTNMEQVFHFYVVNNKAKALKPSQLRSIVSTSLSDKEIGALYNRFKQVGVAADEARWTHSINTDAKSPFLNAIRNDLPHSSGVIPDNVAHQLISKFMKMPRKYKPLFKDIPTWGEDEFKLEIFFGLWEGVKEHYPTAWQEALEGTNPQILQKVCLIQLQEYLLNTMIMDTPRRDSVNDPSPLSDRAITKTVAIQNLHYLPEKFFTKKWQIGGLDTGEGHKIFRQCIDDAIRTQGQGLGNQKLFKTTSK